MKAIFENREDAAERLAKVLEKYSDEDAVILCIPRGGVPIGAVLSKKFGFPLEIILSKKIGHPNNPEYAVGSVTMDDVLIDESVMAISDGYIDKEVKEIQKLLKKRFTLFMGNRRPISLKGKTVIIVDDGIATGNTIFASINVVKKNKPKKIILAVPVAPASLIGKLSKEVDEFICLLTPENFDAVGAFYTNFSQVSDAEVIQLLKETQD